MQSDCFVVKYIPQLKLKNTTAINTSLLLPYADISNQLQVAAIIH